MSIEFRFVEARRDAGILCEVNSAVPFGYLAPGRINSSSSSSLPPACDSTRDHRCPAAVTGRGMPVARCVGW